MRYGGHPSDEQLRLSFDAMLEQVLSGRGLRTETGLDLPTVQALRAVGAAFPNASQELIAQARKTFSGQLDGSNAAARRAEMDRLLAEDE